MKALLIIDMLNDFVAERGVLFVGPQVQGVIAFSQNILERYRHDGSPVIYVCDAHRPDDTEFKQFPPHCVEGSWGAQVVEALQPQEKEVIIPKRRFSAFFGTALDMYLREMEVRELDIVGVCTNICVLYTCAEARMFHYGVRIYREGVTSFDLAAHEWALQEMRKTLGAEVI
ncbi:MAG: cysteine hydrolase family protein [Candidatus Caldatribacteriaceae bacterium]